MNGLQYIDGQPYVWGMPAMKDDEPPLLDCFSQWRCPHCNAHMSSGEKPICLNACHLTERERPMNCVLGDENDNNEQGREACGRSASAGYMADVLLVGNEYEIGDSVYLRTDTDQKERIVTAIMIRPGRMAYELTCGTEGSWHYAFEITKERDVLKAT